LCEMVVERAKVDLPNWLLEIVRAQTKRALDASKTPWLRSSPSTKRFIKNPDSIHQDSNPTNVFTQPAPI
jgi:Ser/Thr protein kinase RdoA (MazF antagonist)